MLPRRLIFCCAALLASVLVAACGSTDGTEVVATAGGDSINAKLLDHWSRVSEHALHRGKSSARARALDYLIVSAWVRAEAKRRRISVGADDVARTLEVQETTTIGGPKEFESVLSHSGETLSDARWQIETEALYRRLKSASVLSHTKVPAMAVAAYYRDHRARFRVPERRFYFSESRKTERQAARDRRSILAGGPFPNKQLESLSRDEIGRVGPVRTKLQRAVFAAPVGALLGPFRNEPPEAHTLVKLIRIVPARIKPFADVKTQIAHTLVVAAERRAAEAFSRTWQTDWRRATHCRRPDAAPACQSTETQPLPLSL